MFFVDDCKNHVTQLVMKKMEWLIKGLFSKYGRYKNYRTRSNANKTITYIGHMKVFIFR